MSEETVDWVQHFQVTNPEVATNLAKAAKVDTVFGDPKHPDDDSYLTLRGLVRSIPTEESSPPEKKPLLEDAEAIGLARDEYRQLNETLTTMGGAVKFGLEAGVRTILQMPDLRCPEGKHVFKPISPDTFAYYYVKGLRRKHGEAWIFNRYPDLALFEFLHLWFECGKNNAVTVQKAELDFREEILKSTGTYATYEFSKNGLDRVLFKWNTHSGKLEDSIDKIHQMPEGYRAALRRQTGPVHPYVRYSSENSLEKGYHTFGDLNFRLVPEPSLRISCWLTVAHAFAHVTSNFIHPTDRACFRRELDEESQIKLNGRGISPNLEMSFPEFTALYAGILSMLPITSIRSPETA